MATRGASPKGEIRLQDAFGLILGIVGLVGLAVTVYPVVRSAALGRIDVNSAVGIRTRTTKQSQNAWEIGHSAALPYALASSVTALMLAALSVASAIWAESAGGSFAVAYVCLLAGYLGSFVVLIVGSAQANRAINKQASALGSGSNATNKGV